MMKKRTCSWVIFSLVIISSCTVLTASGEDDALRQKIGELAEAHRTIDEARLNHTMALQELNNTKGLLDRAIELFGTTWNPEITVQDAQERYSEALNYTLVTEDILEESRQNATDKKEELREFLAFEKIKNAEPPKINELNFTRQIPTNDRGYDPAAKIINVVLWDCDADYCPTYHDLIPFDNSNPRISGEFVNGSRQPTPYERHWKFYNAYSDFIVMVDPNDMQHSQKRIQITAELPAQHLIWNLPSFRNYTIGCFGYGEESPVSGTELRDPDSYGDRYGGECRITRENSTRTTITPHEYHESWFKSIDNKVFLVFENRIITNCQHAIIPADNWRYVLTDTIEFMRHGCDLERTAYKLATPPEIEKGKWLPSHSYEYTQLKYWLSAAEECRTKCL